ncbi:MAG: type II toxin-antitoxin system HipA family toxin, partial [Propionibacteriaceae bacterium]|nr:type II toxin-antitoxin system HipA family toxin [Propionibacteriaceae bacterium]
MTSETIYLWGWLPSAVQPIVVGGLQRRGRLHTFAYARSYLEHPRAIPLYAIPLERGAQHPPEGMTLHGAIRDALPDSWGQRVIASRLLGVRGPDLDVGDVALATYMLESGSDRFGALDFQASAFQYQPRTTGSASVEDLINAADLIDEGLPLPAALSTAFEHGTSVGGARPKVTTVDSEGRSWIVKLSSTTDIRPVVRLEALAYELARRAGIPVTSTKLTRIAGHDCLWVERFDRTRAGRHMAVSGLTLCQLDEMVGRYATYPTILTALRAHGTDPGPELFCRVALNIALGNSDDHARNLAALWDGRVLRLAPAYDLEPCRSTGWDSNQAMAYGEAGQRASSLRQLVACHGIYSLTKAQAAGIVEG